MSLELPKIEAENIEDHERQLEKELSKIQILYADHLFENSDKTKTFSGILDEIGSYIFGKLKDIFQIQNKNLDRDTYKTKEGEYLKKCSTEIDEIYSNAKDDNLNITETILDHIKKLEEDAYINFPGSEEKKHEPKNKIGLLRYVSTEEDGLNPKIRKKMNEEGFEDTDPFLIIHLDAAFKNENGVKDAIKWLEILAEKIIDQHPQTKGIIGTSWLFDHPAIQRKLGFKNLYDDEQINWNQFIDKDGQIKKDLVCKLLEKNKPPFKNLVAYDDVISFLNKFLPKNRRGDVNLKNINPEWEECYSEEKFTEDSKKFRNEFDPLENKTKENIENIFNSLPKFKEIWQKLSLYEKLIEILINSAGKERKIVYNNNLDFFEKTKGAIKQYFANIVLPEKYVTKKTFIN